MDSASLVRFALLLGLVVVSSVGLQRMKKMTHNQIRYFENHVEEWGAPPVAKFIDGAHVKGIREKQMIYKYKTDDGMTCEATIIIGQRGDKTRGWSCYNTIKDSGEDLFGPDETEQKTKQKKRKPKERSPKKKKKHEPDEQNETAEEDRKDKDSREDLFGSDETEQETKPKKRKPKKKTKYESDEDEDDFDEPKKIYSKKKSLKKKKKYESDEQNETAEEDKDSREDLFGSDETVPRKRKTKQRSLKRKRRYESDGTEEDDSGELRKKYHTKNNIKKKKKKKKKNFQIPEENYYSPLWSNL